MIRKSLLVLLTFVLLTGIGFLVHKKFEFRTIASSEEFVFVVHKKKSAKQIEAEKAANELRKSTPIEIPDPAIVPIQQVTDNSKPIIAFFYVDWCGYCQRFMPIYGKVAKKYKNKYNFAIIHCEKPENKAMVEEFGVHGFPTLYIVDRKVNFKYGLPQGVTQSEEALKKELDNYFNARKNFSK